MDKHNKERIVRKVERLWKNYIIDWAPKSELNQEAFNEGVFVGQHGLARPEDTKVLSLHPEYGYDGFIDFLEGYNQGVKDLAAVQTKETRALKIKANPIHVEIE